MVAAMSALVFMGAALVFLAQPLAAARTLPVFGGGPAVFAASLLVFQTLLLLGYALAGAMPISRWRGVFPFWAVSALVLAALGPAPAAFAGPDLPTLRMVLALSLDVGLPYLLLSATTPLVTRATGAGHRLYALSNAGSLVGLFAGPLVVEPLWGASAQRILFHGLFAIWAAGVYGLLRRAVKAAAPPDTAPPSRTPSTEGRAVRAWLGFSALGTGLLCTTSAAISQDLSATPLLWVLPLAAYLVTLIAAFGRRSLPSRAATTAGAGLSLLLAVGLLRADWRLPWALQLGGYVLVLLGGAFAAHAEMVRRRPPPDGLPRFYLVTAAGGALGTLAFGHLLPALSPVPLELPLAALALWLALPRPLLAEDRERNPLRPQTPLRALLVATTLVLISGYGHAAWRRLRGDARWVRSVYGALQIKSYGRGDDAVRHLLDGRISHGFQYLTPERRSEPTAYFARETGIGRLLSQRGPARSVGVLGLGVGTLAAYGRAGDHFTFFEINPAVVAVARTHFTFLADSAAEVEIVEGDARLMLAATDRAFDVIVVDAFSGDAIPVHLITAEAVDLYRARLASDGVIAVNVSNRHADLGRVVHAHADRTGMAVGGLTALTGSPLDAYRSDWAFLAFRADALDFAPGLNRPSLPGADEPVLFTDDYAPVLRILR
jgi:hypothetical protein